MKQNYSAILSNADKLSIYIKVMTHILQFILIDIKLDLISFILMY